MKNDFEMPEIEIVFISQPNDVIKTSELDHEELSRW